MPRENTLLSVGDPAPTFTLPDAGGTPHTPIAAAGAGGKVALFFFRGIWCPSCRRQMSQLRQHYDALAGAGWAIYGVTPGRADAVADYTRQEQIRYPVLIDADRAVSKLYGVFTPFSHDGFNVPTVNMPHNSTILIDSGGRIRYIHVGARSTDLPDESALLAAMAQVG